jgi:hypothetical protein
LQASR